jgi:DNA-binding NtrC family response regulator
MKNRGLPADVFFEALRNSQIEPLRRKPVLVICDDEECGDTVAQIIRKRGIGTVCCPRLSDARSFLPAQIFSAVFCSDSLPDGDFRTVIGAVDPTPVIVFSRLADWDGYLEAVHRGAFDYTACPPDAAEIERILRFAISEPSPVHKNP